MYSRALCIRVVRVDTSSYIWGWLLITSTRTVYVLNVFKNKFHETNITHNNLIYMFSFFKVLLIDLILTSIFPLRLHKWEMNRWIYNMLVCQKIEEKNWQHLFSWFVPRTPRMATICADSCVQLLIERENCPAYSSSFDSRQI